MGVSKGRIISILVKIRIRIWICDKYLIFKVILHHCEIGPQTIFQRCVEPDMFSWIRHCVAEVCALPSALLVPDALCKYMQTYLYAGIQRQDKVRGDRDKGHIHLRIVRLFYVLIPTGITRLSSFTNLLTSIMHFTFHPIAPLRSFPQLRITQS